MTSSWRILQKKIMLYFTIGLLVNISLTSTLQRCMGGINDLHWQVNSSLVSVLVDTIFGMEDTESGIADEDDDASIDFLYTRLSWTLNHEGSVKIKKISLNNSLTDHPALEKFTPPPKA